MEIERKKRLQKLILLLAVKKKYIDLLTLCSLTAERTRVWTISIYTEQERSLYGFFNQLFQHIKNNDSIEFQKATRMGVNQFMLLLNLIKERITKQDCIRHPIPPESRLAITLV